MSAPEISESADSAPPSAFGFTAHHTEQVFGFNLGWGESQVGPVRAEQVRPPRSYTCSRLLPPRVQRVAWHFGVQAAELRFHLRRDPPTDQGLEAWLTRRLRPGPADEVTMLRYLRQAGSTLSAAHLRRLALIAPTPRFGPFELGRWALTPWTRMAVAWRPSLFWGTWNVEKYVTTAVQFWSEHRHCPSEAEEPSHLVRDHLIHIQSLPQPPAYFVRVMEGAFRQLTPVGPQHYRLVPERLPAGDLFTLYQPVGRVTYRARAGRVWAGREGHEEDCTPYATRLLVQALNLRPGEYRVIWHPAGQEVRRAVQKLRLLWGY